ncbi:MAG: DUF4875 domain-containing protein [Proteobacteria bacterium]|nr:DUF4875 domain-containing protein [Pseudomonadota bacterium]
MKRIALITLIILNILCFNSYADDNLEPISGEDISFPGRIRYTFVFEMRDLSRVNQEVLYNTAMTKAKYIQKTTNAHLVEVYLKASANSPLITHLAKAVYSYDNGGYSGDDNFTWKVEAVKKLPTPKQLEIARLWKKLKTNYMDKNGIVNHDELKKAIAKKLDIKYTETTDSFGTSINIGRYYALTETIKL